MNYRVKNIGIAIGLAALAAILTSVYVVNYKRHVQRGEDKVTVLVAARDIPAGTAGADIIDQKMLKEQTVPRKAIVAGAISTPDQLSQYVATQDVYEGEQVSTRRFAPPSEQGIRSLIKGTQRAYQLPGTVDQLLAGTIQNGDHVDVVGTWRSPTARAVETERSSAASSSVTCSCFARRKARRRPRSRLPVRAARPSSCASPMRRLRSCSGFKRTAKATARATT